MTTTPSTPDTPEDAFPNADDAAQYTAYVQLLHRQLNDAQHTADALQKLGDQWHDEQIALPLVAMHGDFTDVFEPGCPASTAERTQLVETLKSAARQAYTLAGHYRRVIPTLTAMLQTELNADEPTYAVLTYAALDRISYDQAAAEWLFDGKPAPDLQHAVQRLQQAELLDAAGSVA